ncbi:hypothetical protein PML78_04715 [Enterococcus dispar]|uniref:hypothetical protein n=1 Tax=Enterococcus dispar TaxID=44009 RepID=UPI00232D4FE1|nr:hypothetical protein [Enterococcus dispar]WCG33997.1 hypothetical protein PML78_04715 [Enterococcus dispar]
MTRTTVLYKGTEKQILFQGTSYRILENDRYNVVLEVQNSERNYQFAGYYPSIEKALRALVRRDMLISRHEMQDMKSYLKEIASYKRQLIADIEAHFSAEDDELFN